MNRTVGTFFIVLILLMALTGCTGANSKEVVVAEKSEFYHRPDCALVKMAKTISMTVAQARAEHLKPCPACKPDTL